MTARVVADEMTRGGPWSYLQSSVARFSVYVGLGFSALERWDSRIAPL